MLQSRRHEIRAARIGESGYACAGWTDVVAGRVADMQGIVPQAIVLQ
jgi:hypothetical protein